VITTTDPERVIDLAEQEHPRLIISDIAMPGLNGLSLLKQLKNNPATRDIPLILLTSSRDMNDVQEGLSSGAEAYLVKPIDWDLSWPKIQAILLRS
jgi:CheY-like chemotaxis protein